jgi:hypothetical protein
MVIENTSVLPTPDGQGCDVRHTASPSFTLTLQYEVRSIFTNQILTTESRWYNKHHIFNDKTDNFKKTCLGGTIFTIGVDKIQLIRERILHDMTRIHHTQLAFHDGHPF